MLRAILVDAEGLKPSGRWVDNRQPALCRARQIAEARFGLRCRFGRGKIRGRFRRLIRGLSAVDFRNN
jgi:hypothetical protein